MGYISSAQMGRIAGCDLTLAHPLRIVMVNAGLERRSVHGPMRTTSGHLRQAQLSAAAHATAKLNVMQIQPVLPGHTPQECIQAVVVL
jgi:hypothetical protein